jgi:hypothetical protein
MSVLAPVVLKNGQIQQLQVGDTLPGSEQAATTTKVVWVNVDAGNDTTGDGSWIRPFKTMTSVMAAITDASLSKRYTVKVAPGNYPENWAVKGNVAIFGWGVIPVRFTGSVTLDSSFGTNTDQRSSFHNCSFIGSSSFNFATDGGNSPQGKLYFYSCRFSNVVTITNGSAGTTTQTSFFLCHFFAGVNITATNPTSFANCSFVNGGNIVINALTGNLTTTVVFYGGGCDGGMQINYVGTSLGPIVVTLLGFTLQGNVTFPTFTGSGTGTPLTLTTTANGLQNNPSMPAGTVLNYLTQSFGVAYAPTTSGNWRSPAPTTVLGALDALALAAVTAIDRAAPNTSVSNTTTETTVYTKSVPGNLLGTLNRARLQLFAQLSSVGLLPGTLTVRIYYGSAVIAILNAMTIASGLASAPVRIEGEVSGLGATNSQLLSGKYEDGSESGLARGTGAIDSTAAQTLKVTVQFGTANAANVFVSDHCVLEIIK